MTYTEWIRLSIQIWWNDFLAEQQHEIQSVDNFVGLYDLLFPRGRVNCELLKVTTMFYLSDGVTCEKNLAFSRAKGSFLSTFYETNLKIFLKSAFL